MAVQDGYPGVHVVEVPSGVRPIAEASTSSLALIGSFARGPVDEAVRVTSLSDFERHFGGLDRRSDATYALQQFFQQGGRIAYVVRIAFRTARVTLGRDAPALEIVAATPGVAGDGIRVGVAHNGAARFDLRVQPPGGAPAVDFRNVSADPDSDRHVATVINTTPDSPIAIRAARARPTESNPGTPLDALAPGDLAPLVNGADAVAATLTLDDGGTGLALRARNPGARGEAITVATVPDGGAGTFSLTVTPPVGDAEQFDGVTPDAAGLAQVNASAHVEATRLDGLPPAKDAPLEDGADAVVSRLNLQPDVTVPALVLAARATGPAAGFTARVRPATDADPAHFNLELPDGASGAVTVENLDPAAGLAPVQAAIAGQTDAVRALEIAGRPDDMPATAPFAGGGEPVPAASVALRAGGGASAVTVAAASAGEWGNALRVGVAPDPDGGFELRVVEYRGGEIAEEEGFPRLSVADGDPRNAAELINALSRLVRITDLQAEPAPTATDAGGAPVPVDDLALDAMHVLSGGEDGMMPDSPDWPANAPAFITGAADGAVGIAALDGIAPDVFNIMAIPEAARLTTGGAQAVYAAASDYCLREMAFLLVDHPATADPADAIDGWVNGLALGAARGRSAAICYPRLVVPDVLNGNRDRQIPTSGAMAGVMARIDARRGVWKAPAGTEASIAGARPSRVLTDLQQGRLNKLGINALRSFAAIGTVNWGARTMAGADRLASEWKYMPVRRMALFLEQSLSEGLIWVTFEPNDAPLWGQIRLNVTSFMQNLFLRGAFQGTSPREAYLVKCDAETTTQADIDRGVVNILVGFAPLKPTEFVLLRLRQEAGRPQA